MFDRLEKHHIGIIITNEKRVLLEAQGITFHEDTTKGTNVSFVMDNELGMYKEFIVKEGRVANVKAGFYHFCYNVPNVLKMKSVEDKIKESSLGYPLTKLEKSESEECGWVKFYFIKNHGVVEFNLLEDPNV